MRPIEEFRTYRLFFLKEGRKRYVLLKERNAGLNADLRQENSTAICLVSLQQSRSGLKSVLKVVDILMQRCDCGWFEVEGTAKTRR